MIDEKRPVHSLKKRGIFLLPSMFTILGLLCGFYALIGATQGNYAYAAWAIVAAAVFDMLDGRVARMLDAESAFGAELDSLCDMLSFGVAPAMLVYLWALTGYDKLGWLVAFLIVACSALRLARFNVQLASQDKRYFQGLPTPALALMVASAILFHDKLDLQPVASVWLVSSVLLAWLLVSNVRFLSGKDFDLKQKRPFTAITILLGVIVMLVAYPVYMLFGAFLLYCVHGPVLSAWQGQKAARLRLLKRKQRAQLKSLGDEDER
ncbi:MAG: CDP-diacylglycerol--serine O-phosphatidyltransferase [Ghiorsea sp.]